jgi:hypothetical protein
MSPPRQQSGEANDAGASLVSACGVTGICLRTLKRWRKAFLGDGDGKERPKASSRLVVHRLSEEERQRIRASISAPRAAFTGSYTRQGSGTAAGGPGCLRNRAPGRF